MNTFFSLIAILSLFGGIFYFAWKSDDMGVSWSFMLLGIFFFPIGAIVGFYWVLNDLCLYYLNRPLLHSSKNHAKDSSDSNEKDGKESKYSLKE
jgi:hypothetical protein